MQIKENSFTIVLAGNWNQFILTPLWIKENVFDTDEIKVEFSTNPMVIMRYRVKNIFLSVDNLRIILYSADNSDESLKLMEETAIKLCCILSHTPLIGVGINFTFIERDNKDELFKLFKFIDDELISSSDWVSILPSISRKFKKENEILNLKIHLDPNNDVNFEFNYHHDITSCKNVEGNIKNKVVYLKNVSIDFLKTIYSLTL